MRVPHDGSPDGKLIGKAYLWAASCPEWVDNFHSGGTFYVFYCILLYHHPDSNQYLKLPTRHSCICNVLLLKCPVGFSM